MVFAARAAARPCAVFFLEEGSPSPLPVPLGNSGNTSVSCWVEKFLESGKIGRVLLVLPTSPWWPPPPWVLPDSPPDDGAPLEVRFLCLEDAGLVGKEGAAVHGG